MTLLRRNYKKTLIVAIFLSIVLLTELAFKRFYPDWSFRTVSLINSNRVFTLTAFFGLLFCVVFLFKVNNYLTIIIGLALAGLLYILSRFTVNPIDTDTEPVDKTTLTIFPDRTKLVVRQYKNAKTNREIQDTILVKDIFVFRHRLDKRK